MNIFLISPIRAVTAEFNVSVAQQVAWLEDQGHTVYWPARDTDQSYPARKICQVNRKHMRACDFVYVAWDGESEGVLFDLGMAWAMPKPLVVLTGLMPNQTTAKSFQNLCYAWEEWGSDWGTMPPCS